MKNKIRLIGIGLLCVVRMFGPAGESGKVATPLKGSQVKLTTQEANAKVVANVYFDKHTDNVEQTKNDLQNAHQQLTTAIEDMQKQNSFVDKPDNENETNVQFINKVAKGSNSVLKGLDARIAFDKAKNAHKDAVKQLNQATVTKTALENNLAKFGTFKVNGAKTTLAVKDLSMINNSIGGVRRNLIEQLSSKQKGQIMYMKGLENLKADIRTMREENNQKPSLMQRVKQSLLSLIGKGRSATSNARTTQTEEPGYVSVGGFRNKIAKPADYDAASLSEQAAFRDMVAYTMWGEGKGGETPTSVAEAVAMVKEKKAAYQARAAEPSALVSE